jgi:8-oxo-dGTP pyrophosphatase MutT (NUDIX family)
VLHELGERDRPVFTGRLDDPGGGLLAHGCKRSGAVTIARPGDRIARVGERIRKAAAVIATREGPRGPEVLVLERSAGSRFLPGYVAFPGGATDAEDAAHARRWFGSVEDAPRACAIRELLEEVGVALTAEGLRAAPGEPMDAIEASPPRPEQLSLVAR